MDFAHGYVAQVDRILAAAASLFGAPSEIPDLRLGRATGGRELPEGDSGLAAGAEEAAGRYRSDDARASSLSDALHGAVSEAAAHAQRGIESARSISQTAAGRARAVLAEGSEPHNLILLVTQLDSGMAAMQEHIDTTRRRLGESAQKIEAHGAEMIATHRV